MDADDLSLPDRLERQVAILDAEPDCALVATHAEKIDAFGRQVGLVSTSTDANVLRRRLIRENCIIHGSVTFRREVFDDVGGYDERMSCSQDYDLWLRMIESHRVRVIAEPLYCWRQHPQTISSLRTEEQRPFGRPHGRRRPARVGGSGFRYFLLVRDQ